MSTPVVILQPGNRASVKIPWRGSPEANYTRLKEICGSRTRPLYDQGSKCFLVAKSHTEHVVNALVEEYGQVSLIQFGYAASTCVEQCWNAKSDNIYDCECSCAGGNHGSGTPLGREVQDGLSVQHEFTQVAYIVTSAGRFRTSSN